MRAFFDWMVDKMNKEIDFNSGITVVQPIDKGLAGVLEQQDGIYHLYLQGIKDGKPVSDVTLVDSIQKALNPYSQYNDYIELADNPELRFFVSNTTEAGIAYDESDTPDMQPQNSFPGKVTAFLYRRYKTFDAAPDKGLIFLCCELIDRNGEKLKSCVLKHAQAWKLPETFIDWVNNANIFCNTLVDRIVPGYPVDKIDAIQESLGYRDQLVVEGEYFHVWVIEAPKQVEEEFPAGRAGLNVIFTDNLTPYRERKVRILNGAHTGSFAVSLLSGVETVQEAIEHPQIGRFMKEMVYEEVCPNIDLPASESAAYAEKTLERFYNPYIKHLWRSIALNSVSKWRTRVLPSLVDYYQRTKSLPTRIAFSLAALISYYRGVYQDKPFRIDDGDDIVAFFSSVWKDYKEDDVSALTLCRRVLKNTDFWNTDLNDFPGLAELVAGFITDIQKMGMPETLDRLVNS